MPAPNFHTGLEASTQPCAQPPLWLWGAIRAQAHTKSSSKKDNLWPGDVCSNSGGGKVSAKSIDEPGSHPNRQARKVQPVQ
jgi:hypothetical protein